MGGQGKAVREGLSLKYDGVCRVPVCDQQCLSPQPTNPISFYHVQIRVMAGAKEEVTGTATGGWEVKERQGCEGLSLKYDGVSRVPVCDPQCLSFSSAD